MNVAARPSQIPVLRPAVRQLRGCNRHTFFFFTPWLYVVSVLPSLVALESFKNEAGLLPGIVNMTEICHAHTSFGTIQ